MSSPEPTEPPSDDVLAAELVLGVLDPGERRTLQARVDADRVFAERVAYWERRFAPWLSDIEAAEPPARVWTRICQRLGWQESEPAASSLRGSLALWRTVAVLSALVAVVAVWVAVQSPATRPIVRSNPPEMARQAVTALWHDDGSPGWLVSIDPSHGTLLVVPVPTRSDSQGRAPQLWVIPPGKAPKWVASVSSDMSETVTVPSDARASLVAGSVLAVSLEPPGVAEEAPTGPIVAKGSI
ncbi:MAG TPA: anti-sigma factor [Steroidobacteraceae bacterium]